MLDNFMGGSLRQRLGDFVGVLDEKLRDRAERTVFQGDDSDWHVGHRQLNRQDLQLRAPGAKFKCGGRKRQKTPGRQQAYPYLGGIGDQRRARVVEPAGAKRFHRGCPRRAFRPWQRPEFVHQIGELNPAPPSPWTLHTCQDDK